MVSQTQTFVGADISIHALHEESDTVAVCESAVRQVISIHALHEESDARQTPHAGPTGISIHALHEESDGVVQSSAFDR